MAPPWVEIPPERSERWNPLLVRMISVGHVPSVVDWLWLRSLQDPMLFHVPAGVHPPLYYDLSLATDLDPAYEEAYLVGAQNLAVIRDDRQGALELALKAERFRQEEIPRMPPEFGRRFWLPRWRTPFLLAYLYLFEFDDVPSASKYYQGAASLPGAPAYLAHLSQKLKTRQGQYRVALDVIDFLIEGSKDEDLLERLGKKRFSLLVNRFLNEVNEEFAAFRGKTRKQKPAAAFQLFLAQRASGERDPFGGKLSLREESGRIATSTPHESVLGMRED
jgi:hypothetical protein